MTSERIFEMKVFILALAALAGFTNSQMVNNVHLMGHTSYMINVLQEVTLELERRGWCNLKVPDITVALNENVLDHHYEGSVTYSKGFLVSMQHIDILHQRLDQVWSWNATDETGTVNVRATLRMHDLTLGYDVVVNLEDRQHRYTMAITYPLSSFTFNIWKNVNTEDVRVEVEGVVSTTSTIRTIKFLPIDNTTDVLTTLFDVGLPAQGIRAWGDNVLLSVTLEAYNKIEFPRICYDCPLAATMNDIL